MHRCLYRCVICGKCLNCIFTDLLYFTCAKIDKLRAAGYDAPLTELSDAVKDYVVNYLEPGKFLGDEC